jgi:hypothetical protein
MLAGRVQIGDELAQAECLGERQRAVPTGAWRHPDEQRSQSRFGRRELRAFCAMRGSPGARTYYQQLRDRDIGHQAALRQLANRLVGILHGCLKTRTAYNEHTAWAQRQQ